MNKYATLYIKLKFLYFYPARGKAERKQSKAAKRILARAAHASFPVIKDYFCQKHFFLYSLSFVLFFF